MGPTPPIALPPVTAEYSSTLQQAGGKLPAAQSQYRFSRAADGKTRVDTGNTSVISNPAASQTIVLDHVKKTATIQPGPSPAPPNPPGMPQMPNFSAPSLPGQPHVPGVTVQDLGKAVLEGHEVEGKRFVVPPLAPPKPPAFQMPGIPKVPQIPGMPSVVPKTPQIPGMASVIPKTPQIPGMASVIPKTPQIPGMASVIPKTPQIPGMPPVVPKTPQMPGMPPPPAAPPPPATTDVWNSTRMGVPILTKMSGSFGQLTQVCRSAVPGEPHPSAFQIPQGYKVIGTTQGQLKS
jgi:hypothetical protein